MHKTWKRTAGALLVLMTAAAAPAWAETPVDPIRADFTMEIPATRALPPVVTVNGQIVLFGEQGPAEMDGVLMLPLRAVVEASGGTVTWNGEDMSVTVRLHDRTALFYIDQDEAEMNEDGVRYIQRNMIRMARPVALVHGRTMISADALTDIFGWGERPDRDLNLDLVAQTGPFAQVQKIWTEIPEQLKQWAGTVGEQAGHKALVTREGIYLAIAGGMQNSGGWQIELVSDVEQQDGTWVVKVELLPPDGPATMALTNPVAYFYLPGIKGEVEVQFISGASDDHLEKR